MSTLEYPAIAKLGQIQCTFFRHESAPLASFPIGSKRLWSPRTKKADVAEHPKAFGHVGLLFNEPPGKAGLFFI